MGLYLSLRSLINPSAVKLVGKGWDDLSADVALVGRTTFDARFRAHRHPYLALGETMRAMRHHYLRQCDP
jgi:hypothetical protein